MDKDLYIKAKVTGKRQITIPKEVCDLLNIETGKQVVFKSDGSTVIFDIEGEKCFACNGAGEIAGKECFVCRGKGEIESSAVENVFNLVANITEKSLIYKIGIMFLTQGADSYGMFKYKEMPTFSIRSSEYPEKEINRIQDEIQKKVIEHFSPKSLSDNNLFCCPSDRMLEMILDTLVTEEAKEEVRKWFREDRVVK